MKDRLKEKETTPTQRETKINLLQASHGDCILIETFDKKNTEYTILIDGGPLDTFERSLIKVLSNKKIIDLIILTHIDSDHIAGLLEYLKSDYSNNNIIRKILINAPNLVNVNHGNQITYDEGTALEKILIKKFNGIEIISNATWEEQPQLDLPDGIEIKILSPNKEAIELLYKNWPKLNFENEEPTQISNTNTPYAKDYDKSFKELSITTRKDKEISSDIFNASSIAFSIKTPDAFNMFLGDAHPKIVCDSIKAIYKDYIPLSCDNIKLSHHGSKFNISNDLLSLVTCNNYIISANGGKGRAKHPDRETVAKIVMHNNMEDKKVNFIFNYPLSEIEGKTGRLFNSEELSLFTYQIKSNNHE